MVEVIAEGRSGTAGALSLASAKPEETGFAESAAPDRSHGFGGAGMNVVPTTVNLTVAWGTYSEPRGECIWTYQRVPCAQSQLRRRKHLNFRTY